MKVVKVTNSPHFNIAVMENEGQGFIKASSAVFPPIEQLPLQDAIVLADLVKEIQAELEANQKKAEEEQPEAEPPKKKS